MQTLKVTITTQNNTASNTAVFTAGIPGAYAFIRVDAITAIIDNAYTGGTDIHVGTVVYSVDATPGAVRTALGIYAHNSIDADNIEIAEF